MVDTSVFLPHLTPVEEVEGGLLLKRDDLFTLAGVRGGKVRSCWHLAQGATGLVTAGSRHSPQGVIVARIGQHLKISVRVHIAYGPTTSQMQQAIDAGAELVRHKPGYNNVIIARARKDATDRGWRDIPFGMRCQGAVDQTSLQVDNLPLNNQFKRIVVPVGSGISLAGILQGIVFRRPDLNAIPVLGVQVGADPRRFLKMFAPFGWAKMVTLVPAKQGYHERVYNPQIGALVLDAHYEAKCLPFLRSGDLFWVVGIRQD